MALEKLEPLYRYLESINGEDAVSHLIGDMEQLAKKGYIENAGEGRHAVVKNGSVKQEITKILRAAIDGDSPAGLHVMCQAIGKNLYLSMSRVTKECSKTCLSIVIDEGDNISVDYIEPDVFTRLINHGDTTYSAVNATIVQPDGTVKRGFIRYEVRFVKDRNAQDSIGILIDFKMTRAAPMYIYLGDLERISIFSLVGRQARERYERMESEWTV